MSKYWNARYGKSHKKAMQFRSSRALKQDRKKDSQEPWEKARRKVTTKPKKKYVYLSPRMKGDKGYHRMETGLIASYNKGRKVTKGVAKPIARGSTTNKASKIGGGYAESLGRFL